MNKIDLKPKPLSKAERVYLDQIKKRPADTIFREAFSKAQNTYEPGSNKNDHL